MVYTTLKAFCAKYNINYESAKKWKQRGLIKLQKDGSINDKDSDNIALLEDKGIITTKNSQVKAGSGKGNNKRRSATSKALSKLDDETLRKYVSELDEMAGLDKQNLEKLLKLVKIRETGTRLDRVKYLLGVDQGLYIERKMAKQVVIGALRQIVMPLTDFGSSPLASRIEEVFAGDLPRAEKEKRVSELMCDYARSFESVLVEAEQQLDELGRNDGE